MTRVLVVGDVMTDILARIDEPFARGSDAAARISERPGGSAATFAARLAQAGVAVDFVGRVGAGDVERISDAFRRAGVTPWLADDPVAPTGRLIAVVEPSGERSFLTDRGANDALALADIPPAAMEGASWLHLTGYSFQHPQTRAVVQALLARSGGVPVSVDPGSAAPLRAMGAANFLAWTAGAALLLPNADEAAALTGDDDPRQQRAYLAARYPLAVIKRGAAGAEAIAGDEIWTTPAPPTVALDTTGAGDAFAAAFIAARLRGVSIENALKSGVAAGSAATQALGGWPL